MSDAQSADEQAVIDLLDYWTPLMLRAVVDAGVLEAKVDAPAFERDGSPELWLQ